MKAALYPGTFDPITRGHMDIVVRAASLFDRVVVGVYDTPSKTLLFDTAARVDLAREALAHLGNVEIRPYTGLTVEFAAELGVGVLVRGLRAYSDFENELQMAHQNRQMRPAIETVCLMTSLEYSFLSSTLLRDIARFGGEVGGLVPSHVERALRKRFASGAAVDTIPRHLQS
ncbi:MAG TPA: pantetheine-phosphate adenylyltransferase [Chloroflexota bacterium]|nr:pantetheine-phosphate adenylyltransferase [Chloroflexota bacterium]